MRGLSRARCCSQRFLFSVTCPRSLGGEFRAPDSRTWRRLPSLAPPPPAAHRSRGEIWGPGLVHEWSVARNPQEIVSMKEKNKHFCLKTVWRHLSSLPPRPRTASQPGSRVQLYTRLHRYSGRLAQDACVLNASCQAGSGQHRGVRRDPHFLHVARDPRTQLCWPPGPSARLLTSLDLNCM